MIDIQFIRDNPDLVAEKSRLKGYEVDITQLLGFDSEKRQLTKQVDELRQKRNELNSTAKGQKPNEEQVVEGRHLKEELSKLEHQLSSVEKEYQALLENVPNIFPDDTPEGGEKDAKTERTWGEPRQDQVQDHLSWGEARDLIDMERGAKVAGNKFYFLKGLLVQLELAVFQYGLSVATKHGFTPITVPHMVNTNILKGTGFVPKSEVEEQTYKIEGEDLNLIGTAEIPITGYYAGEVLDASKLPILLAGISPAYRREAGAYGKFSRGLYRVHQFNKLELYVFCEPEDSENWQDKLIAIEEELCQTLEIPYRLVRIAAGDLGMPAYKKYDIEYWSPVDKIYRELMSCSNVTDFQARRLGIRYKKADGIINYVNTLNATAVAFSRTCIAIIENNQSEDGKVKIPKVLQKYMNDQTEI